jgi:hypothetical protein
LTGTDPEWDTPNTQNDSEMNKEAEEQNLLRIAKVHDFLEIWQGSQNLHVIEMKTRAQNKQKTTLGYILHTEEIVKASWSLF